MWLQSATMCAHPAVELWQSKTADRNWSNFFQIERFPIIDLLGQLRSGSKVRSGEVVIRETVRKEPKGPHLMEYPARLERILCHNRVILVRKLRELRVPDNAVANLVIAVRSKRDLIASKSVSIEKSKAKLLILREISSIEKFYLGSCVGNLAKRHLADF